jgi:hypothetical protein
MEFYTDGVEYEWYFKIYNEYFGGEDGFKRLIFAGICVVIIVGIIIAVFGTGIKNAICAICCKKRANR